MTQTSYYGAAYRWDGKFWRYAFNNDKVPESKAFVDPQTGDIEIDAPEFLVTQMLDQYQVARIMGIMHASVSRMLTRGDMPQPQIRVGAKTPLWTRPVIKHWLSSRPGRGINFKKGNES